MALFDTYHFNLVLMPGNFTKAISILISGK